MAEDYRKKVGNFSLTKGEKQGILIGMMTLKI
jgi:hypothetical protein